MIYYVYIIYSATADRYYIGQTNDFERRIEEHNLREGRYTSGKGPWKLVYKEECDSRSAAVRREKFLKSGKGREYWKGNLRQSSPPQADWL
jgi:putative endonuclease